MKITVGVCSFEEAKYFIANGADEISFGIESLPSFCDDQSIPGAKIEDIKKIASKAHKSGKKIFIYCNELIPGTKKVAEEVNRLFVKTSADGFIIAGDGIIQDYCHKEKPEWCMGILGMCFNAECINYFKKFGVKRFILPQQITPEEAKKITGIKGIETEFYFTLKENCKNIDGLCLGCNEQAQNTRFCQRNFMLSEYKRFYPPYIIHRQRLEYFYQYYKQADYLKIMRSGGSELKKKQFLEAKELCKLADRVKTKEDFVEKAVPLLVKLA